MTLHDTRDMTLHAYAPTCADIYSVIFTQTYTLLAVWKLFTGDHGDPGSMQDDGEPGEPIVGECLGDWIGLDTIETLCVE